MKQPDPLSQDDVLLNRISQIVLDNLENEQFGVETLAEAIGMSRSYLHRKLKLLNGQSVSQFIREIRLEEALKLLHQDVGTASEIAYRVGFNSSSYFHKCFLARYGFPPSEARNQERGKSIGEVPVAVTSEAKRGSSMGIRTGRKAIGIAFLGVVLLLGLEYWIMSSGEPTPVLSAGKSIAVLPFANLSDETANQHFADGLVEDLLSRLSVVQEFKVISRTSSDTYRERGTKTVPEIARELGVSHIVEGSVQKQGNKIRVAVQLIDAQQDEHVWAQSFDRDLADVFSIQSDIATHVASTMQQVLTEDQILDIQKNRTDNVQAFELYQLGRFHWNRRTSESYQKAIDYFEQAIDEDQEYALAYAGLADTYHLMAIQGYMDKQAGRDKAVELALIALDLDEGLVEAYTVLATLYSYVDFDWAAAERAFVRVFELNPNYATAHHYYSEHLSITGRHEAARKHIEKALDLDPLSFVIHYVSVKLYFHQGLLEEALAVNRRCDELNPNHHWPAWHDFLINYAMGNDTAALNGLKDLLQVSDMDPLPADSVFAASGMEGVMRWRITEFAKEDWFYGMAEFYGYLGEDDQALEMLEKAKKQGGISAEFTFRYPFRHLHTHPRFITLLNKVGLPWEPDSSP